MSIHRPLLSAALLGLFVAAPAGAVPIGHHGGMILHCEPPHFFDEIPAADTRVGSFLSFSVTASENTDPATIKAFINNQQVPVTVDKERSGHYRVQGGLPQAVGKGRVWLKVSADSEEGCDEFKSWFVNVGN
jgi:hypothetical protein